MDRKQKIILEEQYDDFYPCDECLFERDSAACKKLMKDDGFVQFELGCYKEEA